MFWLFPHYLLKPLPALFILICAQGCWPLMMVGFLGSLVNWILHGEASSQRWIGRLRQGCVSMPSCLSAVSLLETEFLLSDHGPLGQLISGTRCPLAQWHWSPSSFSSVGLVASHCCLLLGASPSLSWPSNPTLHSNNHFMKASPLNYMIVNPCLGLTPETVSWPWWSPSRCIFKNHSWWFHCIRWRSSALEIF